MKKIIIAIDSFKGCITSVEANNAVKTGFSQVFPDCKIVCFPVSDGGEGTLSLLTKLSNGHYVKEKVTGPLGEPITANYGISGTEDNTAFIELAAAAGLPQVPLAKRNPMKTTTYGVGELILSTLKAGKKHIIIGIGGSATNDAGTGLLTALGFRFLDTHGHELPGIGAVLNKIKTVDCSHVTPLLNDAEIEVVCDVTNHFYGRQGAAYIFAPQKGANTEMVAQLDKGLHSFAQVIEESTGTNVSQLPGAGAAGGVGGALAAFLHAQLHPGIDFILNALHFDEELSDSDLVISGEGHIDKQSTMGKVVSGILKRTSRMKKPLILFGGGIEDIEQLNIDGITSVFSIIPAPISLAKAMNKTYATEHLKDTAIQIARLLKATSNKR